MTSAFLSADDDSREAFFLSEGSASERENNETETDFLNLRDFLGALPSNALPNVKKREEPFESLWSKLEASLEEDKQAQATLEIRYFDDETVSAYIDGVLPAAEALVLERQLSVQPELASRVGDLLDFQQKLRHYWVCAEANCCFNATASVMQQLDAFETTETALLEPQQLNWLELEQASAQLDGETAEPVFALSEQGLMFKQKAVLLQQALSDYWLRCEERLSSVLLAEGEIQALLEQAGPVFTVLSNEAVGRSTVVKANKKPRSSWRWGNHVAAGLLGILLAGLLNSLPAFMQPIMRRAASPNAGSSLQQGNALSSAVNNSTASSWFFPSKEQGATATLLETSSRLPSEALPTVNETLFKGGLKGKKRTLGEQLACYGNTCKAELSPTSEEYLMQNSLHEQPDDEVLLLLEM